MALSDDVEVWVVPKGMLPGSLPAAAFMAQQKSQQQQHHQPRSDGAPFGGVQVLPTSNTEFAGPSRMGTRPRPMDTMPESAVHTRGTPIAMPVGPNFSPFPESRKSARPQALVSCGTVLPRSKAGSGEWDDEAMSRAVEASKQKEWQQWPEQQARALRVDGRKDAERSVQKRMVEQERMGQQQLSDLAKQEYKAKSERESYTKHLKVRTAELGAEKEMLSKRWAERGNMDRKQLDELRQEKEKLAEMEERYAFAFLGRVVTKWRCRTVVCSPPIAGAYF